MDEEEEAEKKSEKIIRDFQIEDLLFRKPIKINNSSTRRFYRDKTQTEVAQTLGVSQVQISRLESKILEKIRLKY